MEKYFNGVNVEKLCREFQMPGEYLGYEVMTDGHINKTLKALVKGEDKTRAFILQRLNTYVFRHPKGIMQNIISVAEFLRAKMKADGIVTARRVLHYCKTEEGLPYIYDNEGGFWRAYRYIDDSEGINITDDLSIIEESGRAFGEFQKYLGDYEADQLFIAIPHFHNTVNRYRIFKEAIKNDFIGRKNSVTSEIEDYLALEDIATKMYMMQRSGELKLRVTHNDTKSNNVLFDVNTHEHLAVIDLDTVMPGLAGFDYGDAIRFTANAAAEDEKDLSKVYLDMNKFEAFTKGFVGVLADTLTENEINTLALGAITMTVECGMRFLTDYLDGDKYFGIAYPEHNLVRSRCQLALAKDMIKKQDEMNSVIKKVVDSIK